MLDLGQAGSGPETNDSAVDRAVQIVIEALIEMGARDGNDYLVMAGDAPFGEEPVAAAIEPHRRSTAVPKVTVGT
jgi:hypothetical protein